MNIGDYLQSLGIPAHILGFKMWCIAIEYAITNGVESLSMMELYEYIGEVMGKSANSVERNLRSAIEYAFNVTTPDKLFEVFGTVMNRNTGKISNRLFLHTIVYKLTNKEEMI